MDLPGGDGYGVSLPDTASSAAPNANDWYKKFLMMQNMRGGGQTPPAGSGFVGGLQSGLANGLGGGMSMLAMKRFMGK